ncbi:YqzG/YhdC family protein [Bacillus sp. FJAT-29790]|uniref:DUF3889 domain-containing protein n=1 Tax=Bacillus sp. FJAT-29790 TaxID=1895002 RepID=UPI001C235873|nr:DUF3889 domain-containing protein [Bacillus sp. FJAT-29790]MBU8878337.1 YqzG/YhdC family protein [Bacillus sp. FJAT-29790]
MKEKLNRTIISLVFLLCLLYPEHIPSYADPAELSYAKWGQLAMKTAKEKYPTAAIVDYLHIGRENKNHTSIEKFKLLLKENEKEFALYITIEFNPKNDAIIQINIKKASN